MTQKMTTTLFAIAVALCAGLLASSAVQAALPLSGATFHFDAMDISTGDAAQVRTSGPDLFVKQWNDSANSNDISQALDSLQPKYIANGSKFGDRPVVLFDGSNDDLFGAVSGIQNSPGATLFFIGRQSDQTHNGIAVNGTTIGEMGIQHEPSGVDVRFNYRGANGGQMRHNVVAATATDWVQQTLWYDGTQPAGSNGEPRISAYHNYSETADSLAHSGLSISATFGGYTGVILGDNSTTGNVANWEGEIAEVVMFPTALSINDITTMHDYLEGKWNAPVPEPSSLTLLGLATLLCGSCLRVRRRRS